MKSLIVLIFLLTAPVFAQGQGTLYNPALPSGVLPVPNGGLPQLKLTYTGTITSPMVFQPYFEATVPTGARSGTQFYPMAGLGLVQVEFADTGIVTMSFDNLVSTNGDGDGIDPYNCSKLTSLSFPALVTEAGGFTPYQDSALTSLTAPLFVTEEESFGPNALPLLTSLSFPSLVTVGGNFEPGDLAVCTSLSFPLLTTARIVAPHDLAGCVHISLPLLAGGGQGGAFMDLTLTNIPLLDTFSLPSATMIGNSSRIIFSGMTALTTILFPNTIQLGAEGGDIDFHTSNGNIANVVLGTIGTLKYIDGSSGNIDISGQKLTTASVNGILALLVSLDGTNGTTLYGSGHTVNLSGGTSVAPSGQGITDKATLIGRGATITTN